MESTKHLLISLALCLATFIIGTAGYMMIEGWNTDAVYMTIITITTVGFSEIHQMSQYGRIFTIGLVFFGVAFFLFCRRFHGSVSWLKAASGKLWGDET
ncbi:MAG: potassium channel family protein [Desulfobacterales bacterium]